MNLDDLWIGDRVRLKSSGRIGTYIGQSQSGKARVRCGVKVVLSTQENIEYYQDAQKVQPLELIPLPQSELITIMDNTREIDLHIESLNPSLQNEAPQIILNHQVQRCREFINKAIIRRLNSILIIHGRGTGQLKMEVDHLLSQCAEFNYVISAHNDGASEVWFKYK